MPTLTHKYALGDKVNIRALTRDGFIVSIAFNYLGLQYKVEYWSKEEKCEAWCREDELSE